MFGSSRTMEAPLNPGLNPTRGDLRICFMGGQRVTVALAVCSASIERVAFTSVWMTGGSMGAGGMTKRGYGRLLLLMSLIWMSSVAHVLAEEQDVVSAPTTPSGSGAYGNTLFVGAGFTAPQTYTSKADGVAVVGFGIGNPIENVGLQVSTTIHDLSEQDDFSFNVVLHRYIGAGTSISIGGDHLFRDRDEYGRPSYYVALGHSKTAGISRLSTSLGVGSGRFAHKTLRDEAHGRGGKGTYVFGSLAYAIFKRTSLSVEWNGINLQTAISLVPFDRVPFVVMLGAADLTRNSGDRVRFIGGVSWAYRFSTN